MRNTLETKLGIFVCLAIFAGWAIVETLGSTDIFHHGYHIIGRFENVQDLKPGDFVKMAGVEIGRVDDISLSDNKVKVTMKLRDISMVKTDSKAGVKFAGLMGQNFVDIGFGSPDGQPAKDGTELSTYEQPDLSEVMSKLDSAVDGIQSMTKTFASDDIHNLFGPLGDFFKSHKDELGATIENITNITGQIASGRGAVGKMIYDETLYNSALTTVSNLQDASGAAQGMIANINLVVTNASSGKGTLGKLMTDDSLFTATRDAMTNLDQIMIKINDGTGTIGELVNNKDFYKNAKLSLQKIDKMADGLEDQGPLSVISILAGPLGL